MVSGGLGEPEDDLEDGADGVASQWAGIAPIAPRPGEDLAPLIAWLRTGRTPERRLDFPAGTALPDGRLDLCKQAVGPLGVQRIVDALPDSAPAARPAVRHVLLGTAGLGDEGAGAVAEALECAPPGRLRRLSVASNGIGPAPAARLVAAAARTGMEVLDLGRVRAARVLAAAENRIDETAAAAIGTSLAAAPHRLAHLVLTDTGMRSREALSLLRALGVPDRRPWPAPTTAIPAGTGPAPVRIVLGKGVAATVKRQFAELASGVARPAVAADVAAVRSVYRTAL